MSLKFQLLYCSKNEQYNRKNIFGLHFNYISLYIELSLAFKLLKFQSLDK